MLQNVCLQAVSHGAGTVTVGASRDSEAQLYLLPAGKK